MQPDPALQTAARADVDLLVVGGGINGAGIARDAAGRGLSVMLVERDDLGAHTSSASSKLIHGGLRYLEYLEFGLVRRALIEREVLLKTAPHICWPMRFVVPHTPRLRSWWLMRLGLFIYDHLSLSQTLKGSRGLRLNKHVAGQALKAQFTQGFEYADGWVDDARMVVLNCMQAAEHGAQILPHSECLNADREENFWRLSLRQADGQIRVVTARALVNATGPWVNQFIAQRSPARAHHNVRLVKGSHIIVPRLFEHDYAYMLQNDDKRIVFMLPYEQDFTLIGTTDLEFAGDPRSVHIDSDEIDYLCSMANRYLAKPISANDVCASYAGVRPLVEDQSESAAAVTRDYRLELDTQGPPLLSVFGGKITTYRKLSEKAVDALLPLLHSEAPAWTAHASLPGGDMPEGYRAFLEASLHAYPNLPPALVRRWARSYGTRLHVMLGQARELAQLGQEVLPALFEIELRYLIAHEWARSTADILWRRSKLGLHLPADASARLDAWLSQNLPKDAVTS